MDTVWLNSEQAAKMVGCQYKTIYRLVDVQGLPAYRIGRVIRFKQHEVEQWLEGQRIQPGDLRTVEVTNGNLQD